MSFELQRQELQQLALSLEIREARILDLEADVNRRFDAARSETEENERNELLLAQRKLELQQMAGQLITQGQVRSC